MPSISVDIDLDDFDLDDLLAEIEDRVERAARRMTLESNPEKYNARDMAKLVEILDASVEWMYIIGRKYKITLPPPPSASGENAAGPRDSGSLYDRLKMEHILAVIDQYTLDEIESKLPKK